MRIPTNHAEREAFTQALQRTFTIDLSTMTEKLCRGNTLIYEAPLGNCLSHFLCNDINSFALKHEEAINSDINSILSKANVNLTPNTTYDDDEWRIISEILGFDCAASLDEAIQIGEDPRLNLYEDVTWYSFQLSCYAEMFTEHKLDTLTRKLRGDILRAILLEYVDKLDCDSVYRDMGFFCHIFGNNPCCTSGATARIYNYLSFNNSPYAAAEVLNDMRSNYINIRRSGSYYSVEDYTDMCIFTLGFVIKNNLHIRKCRNCGQYFIPRKRSDEIYCDNTAPQDTAKTCKQYGTSRLWYERLKDDPIMKKCKNVYNEKLMRSNRHPDITAYTKNLETFKQEAAQWKKRYKAGACTAEEFSAWLDEQKARKT